MSEEWFARQYDEEGKPRVAQAERQGCALIFSSQWPDKIGKGLMFVSLNVEGDDMEMTKALDRLRVELEGRGVAVSSSAGLVAGRTQLRGENPALAQ